MMKWKKKDAGLGERMKKETRRMMAMKLVRERMLMPMMTGLVAAVAEVNDPMTGSEGVILVIDVGVGPGRRHT